MDVVAAGITVCAATIAAVIDAFTGEIPEWLTIPLAVFGLIYAFLHGYGTSAMIVAAITLGVGYAMYYTGQLGGGDVLLLTGIGAWMPFVLPPQFGAIAYVFNLPFAVLFLGLLLSSTFFSIYYSAMLGRSNRWFFMIPIPYLFLSPLLAVTYGAIVTATLGTKYREELFVREKSVEDLVPEDVLAEDVEGLPPGKHVLEKQDIELLKSKGIQRVKILDNLPRFGPFILLALLTILWFESNPANLDLYASALLSLKIYLFP